VQKRLQQVQAENVQGLMQDQLSWLFGDKQAVQTVFSLVIWTKGEITVEISVFGERVQWDFFVPDLEVFGDNWKGKEVEYIFIYETEGYWHVADNDCV